MNTLDSSTSKTILVDSINDLKPDTYAVYALTEDQIPTIPIDHNEICLGNTVAESGRRLWVASLRSTEDEKRSFLTEASFTFALGRNGYYLSMFLSDKSYATKKAPLINEDDSEILIGHMHPSHYNRHGKSMSQLADVGLVNIEFDKVLALGGEEILLGNVDQYITHTALTISEEDILEMIKPNNKASHIIFGPMNVAFLFVPQINIRQLTGGDVNKYRMLKQEVCRLINRLGSEESKFEDLKQIALISGLSMYVGTNCYSPDSIYTKIA